MRMNLARSAAIIGLIAVGLAPGATSAVGPGPQAAAAAEQARVEAFWTADRLARAIPRDIVLAGSPGGGSDAPRQALVAGDVTGAQWTAGGAILGRSGKIFFNVGLDLFVCSGSVIADGGHSGYSLVITAGHCAWDADTGAFVTNWVYIPAYDNTPGTLSCAATTYGCWGARAFVLRRDYPAQPGLTLVSAPIDYAIAVVGPGGHSMTQLDALGAYPLQTAAIPSGTVLKPFGYPQAPPYDGNQLVYCAGTADVAVDTGDWNLPCNMTGGASGGPWLYGSTDPANGGGSIASVTSYRILNDPNLYGPRFDARTQDVYAAAAAATPDATGIDVILVPSPFTDTSSSPFKGDIEWVYFHGITSGCTATTYCPTAPVTRGQMASFLARALHLTGSAPDAFTDDNGSVYEPNINLVAQAGIASGCGGTNFCPNGLVTREQMASFLARALHLSGPAPDAFTDDNTSIHETNINLVAREGITTGCGGTLYCPTANVTRGQMAAFLHRAFGP
jgi:S-layer homology domain